MLNKDERNKENMDGKEIKLIDISTVAPCKLNPRKNFEKDSLKELQDSIQKHGILQPILVRPNGKVYEIICGERRYRAALAAGLKDIQARIVPMDDKEVLEVQIVENLQRAELHPLEEAEGYEKLMKQHGYAGADQIAAKVGKSKAHVYNRLKLCELVKECRKMFYDGILTPSTAILVARMPKELQKKAADEITDDRYGEGPMHYRKAMEHIQNQYMLELSEAPFAKDDKICPDRGSCATCPKRTGNQALLFADIKEGDLCTDPACFNEKRTEYIRRQSEKAVERGEKNGLKVLTGKDAEQVYPSWSHGDHSNNGWVEMNDKPYDVKERGKSYKNLLRNNSMFKPTLAIDRNGRIHEVAKKTDVDKAMREIGVKFENSCGSESNIEQTERTEQKVRETVFNKVLPMMVESFKADTKQRFWSVFVEIILREANFDRRKCLAKWLSPTSKSSQADEILSQHIKKLSAADMPAFVFELLSTPSYSGWHDYSDAFVEFAELYKIDLNKVEAEVKAEIEKPKAKAGK